MWIILLRRCFTPSGPHASTSSTWEKTPWGSNRPGKDTKWYVDVEKANRRKDKNQETDKQSPVPTHTYTTIDHVQMQQIMRRQQANSLTDQLEMGQWWKCKELVLGENTHSQRPGAKNQTDEILCSGWRN